MLASGVLGWPSQMLRKVNGICIHVPGTESRFRPTPGLSFSEHCFTSLISLDNILLIGGKENTSVFQGFDEMNWTDVSPGMEGMPNMLTASHLFCMEFHNHLLICDVLSHPSYHFFCSSFLMMPWACHGLSKATWLKGC